MPYEITRENLSNPGEFQTETVKLLGSGSRKVKKGQITQRSCTVVDDWQVIRIKEVEEVPVVEEVVEEPEIEVEEPTPEIEEGNVIVDGV